MNVLAQMRRYGAESPDQPSYLDMAGNAAVNTGHAATNLFLDLIRGASPIGTSPEGNMALQVPPLAKEFGNALMSPGRAYFDGMDHDEINRSAASAAGFAMTGGLAAPAVRGGNALMSGGRRVADGEHPLGLQIAQRYAPKLSEKLGNYIVHSLSSRFAFLSAFLI